MKKNRTIILLVVFLGLILLLVFFLTNQNKLPEHLVAGDVVVANIKFSEQLINEKDGELTYFTGTSVATLAFPDKASSGIKSDLLFPDLPFESVDRVSLGKSATVVRAYYTIKDTLLPLDKNNEFVKRLNTGNNWFIVDQNGQVRPLPISDQSRIADCIVVNDQIYILLAVGAGKQNLVRLGLSDTIPATLVENTNATSFVGGKDDNLVLRDFSGKVYVFTDEKINDVAEGVGEIYLDASTGILVTSELESHEVGEEGGSIAVAKEGSKTLKLFGITGQHIKDITVPTSYFYVSKGHLLSISDLSQPSLIQIYNLKNDEQFSIKIDQSQSPVTNQIRYLHVINDDLTLIGAVTNTNKLIAYGVEKYVTKLPFSKLPVIRTSLGEYGYQYNVRSNTLTVFYTDKVNKNEVVAQSLKLFKTNCDCDTNQVLKQWQVTASEPGL